MLNDEDGQENIIIMDNVWKIYRLGKVEFPALRGLSLKIRKGEMMSVMGPSGSGKSTFLHIAGTLDRPTSGKVIINGQDVTKLNDAELTRIRNNIIGFVFQTFNLIPRLTALENVELPLIIRGLRKEERRKLAIQALSLVGLEERLMNKPTEMSGGEQQRVAIARAIVGRPEILLADEPTGNLDSRNSKLVVDILKNINEELGTTIVIVTHNPEVANNCQKIVRIRDGRVESIEVVSNA
ncbi:MAG: ABC transporter ATP-binding protein [Nitrososphaerota archaeon]